MSDDIIARAQRMLRDRDKIIKKCKSKFTHYAKRDIQKIAKQEVENFYRDYTPTMYQRTRSLDAIYEEDLLLYDDIEVFIDIDNPDIIPKTHRADRMVGGDFIYEHVFLGGWHGGAPIGDKVLIPVSIKKPPELYGDDNPPWGKKEWRWMQAECSEPSIADMIKERQEEYYTDVDVYTGLSSSARITQVIDNVFSEYGF